MTDRKWLRASVARRKAAEQQAAADAAARRTRTRRRVTRLGLSLATVAGFVAMTVHSSGSHSWQTILLAVVSALVLIGGFFLHGKLKHSLGRITAVMVIGLGAAILVAGLAEASPTCPGNTVPGRCTTGELANWTMDGLLLPLTFALLIGLPIMMARGGYTMTFRFLRLGHRLGAGLADRVRPGARPADRPRAGAKDAGAKGPKPPRAATAKTTKPAKTAKSAPPRPAGAGKQSRRPKPARRGTPKDSRSQ